MLVFPSRSRRSDLGDGCDLHTNALGLVIPGRDDRLHTRLVMGWSMKDRPNQELVNEALMMAVAQCPPKSGLIHHSDQGILYSSGSYLELLKGYRMLRSMSDKGYKSIPDLTVDG
jgi:hypothetical protein